MTDQDERLPAQPGRRRPRLPDEVIRQRMMHAGREMLDVDGGLTVSLNHLAFEDVIQRAAVSRSAVYRLWPFKDSFYDDLLLDLAGPDWAGSATFDWKTVDIAQDLVDRHAAMLQTLDGRIALMVMVAREGADQNFKAVSTSPQWRTYVALTSTVMSMPRGATREALLTKMREAENRFLERMATFYEEMCGRIGIRLRAEFEGDFRMLAALGASVVEGLGIRQLLTPELTTTTFKSSYFELFGKADWTLASLGFTALLYAMVEPDPGFQVPS